MGFKDVLAKGVAMENEQINKSLKATPVKSEPANNSLADEKKEVNNENKEEAVEISEIKEKTSEPKKELDKQETKQTKKKETVSKQSFSVKNAAEKFMRPEKQRKTERYSFVFSKRASDNIVNYSKSLGFSSINDFINELCERLDEIL